MRCYFIYLVGLIVLFCSVLLGNPAKAAEGPEACSRAAHHFQMALAKADITGAVSGRGMLGYADPLQRSRGLHMRLWSRALYLKDPCSKTQTVMVIADLGLIFGNLKTEVLKKLDRAYPGLFQSEELMISATHTHSGPGGYSAHALYNFTTLGFDQDALENISEGIARSIIKAYQTQFEGRIEFHKGDLPAAQFNRSIEAYQQNPKEERDLYQSDVDSEMQMLVFKDQSGKERGSWNWFPVHGVSLSANNKLLSGDNKGLAAYRLEKEKSVDGIDFIAGFVQSHSGDVSPYAMNNQRDDFQRNEISGTKQFKKAKELFLSSGSKVEGPLRVIERHYDLRNRSLKNQGQSGGAMRKTCDGTLGVTFAAGTENGRPLKIFHEGTVYGRDWPRWTFMSKEQDCQAEKVILLPTGLMKPFAWTSNVAPFQILQIGSLAVAAVPFEMTTMAGRRLKKALLAKLKHYGVEEIVISALANDYLHYVTTREEYSAQAYEGGSTLFGPWSLDAYIEIMEELADEISFSGSRPNRTGTDPIDERPSNPMALPSFPSLDWAGFQGEFGDLVKQPKPEYKKGDRVAVRFLGGELNYRSEDSFVTIQIATGADGSESWKTLYDDGDPQTTVSGKRQLDLRTLVDVTWQIADDEKASRYRICHHGSSQFLWQGRKPYKGCSSDFSVLP